MKKRMNKEKEEKMENAVDFIALISNKEEFVAAYNAAMDKSAFLAQARKAKEAAEKAAAEKAMGRNPFKSGR